MPLEYVREIGHFSEDENRAAKLAILGLII